MELSLTSFQTTLSRELLRQAGKATVRECDETGKGRFVAYVDEGDKSYDVALSILPNKMVGEHSCDCAHSDQFCRHKAALLLHVAGGKKITASVKAKKKQSKAELLLEETEVGALKEWVLDLLQKNKDLELAFTHHFSARQQHYTPEEVNKLTTEAVKAVVKNKRNIDLTQLKKIVELWEEVHAPVVKAYEADVADEKAFLNFHALLESCHAFHLKIQTNSNKIPKYAEGLLQRTAEAIDNLMTTKSWTTATGYFIEHLTSGHYTFRLHYLQHLKTLADISNEERRASLLERLATHYTRNKKELYSDDSQYTRILLDMVKAYGHFAQYHTLFKPIRYDNDYNIELLRLLMDLNELSLAEKYCWQQIEGNSREEFNLPYLELLKEIYTTRSDEDNLARVLASLFPRTYHFEDYLFIYDRIADEEEKKKWRTKILTKARQAAQSYNYAAAAFCFQLMDHEKGYKKMIGYIHSTTSYSLILPYAEPMILTDKAGFLQALLTKYDSYGWTLGYEKFAADRDCFLTLMEVVVKHYTASVVKDAISSVKKSRSYFQPNRFVEYLEKNLPE